MIITKELLVKSERKLVYAIFEDDMELGVEFVLFLFAGDNTSVISI